MIRSKLAVAAPALAAGLLAVAGSAPGAMAKPVTTHHHPHPAAGHTAKIATEVRTAQAELLILRHNAHGNARPAEVALARVTSLTHQAAADAVSAAKGAPVAVAPALRSVAGLYGSEASTFTSLLKGTRGPLQADLARDVKPAVAGESLLVTLLGNVLNAAPGGSAGASAGGTAAAADTLGAISALLNQASGDLGQITSLLASGGLNAQLEQLLGGALTAESATVDQQITDLEALIPHLPAGEQAAATQLLAQLGSEYHATAATLASLTHTIAAAIGNQIATQLGQLTTWLQSLLGGIASNLGNVGAPAGGSAPGAGAAPPATALSGGSLYTALSSLLASLGLPGFGSEVSSTDLGGDLPGSFESGDPAGDPAADDGSDSADTTDSADDPSSTDTTDAGDSTDTSDTTDTSDSSTDVTPTGPSGTYLAPGTYTWTFGIVWFGSVTYTPATAHRVTVAR